MDESKALADAHEAWKQANIARVLHEMERYGLTIADLREPIRTIMLHEHAGEGNKVTHWLVAEYEDGLIKRSEIIKGHTQAKKIAEEWMADILPSMVNQTQTPILPATGYKVAGE